MASPSPLPALGGARGSPALAPLGGGSLPPGGSPSLAPIGGGRALTPLGAKTPLKAPPPSSPAAAPSDAAPSSTDSSSQPPAQTVAPLVAKTPLKAPAAAPATAAAPVAAASPAATPVKAGSRPTSAAAARPLTTGLKSTSTLASLGLAPASAPRPTSAAAKPAPAAGAGPRPTSATAKPATLAGSRSTSTLASLGLAPAASAGPRPPSATAKPATPLVGAAARPTSASAKPALKSLGSSSSTPSLAAATVATPPRVLKPHAPAKAAGHHDNQSWENDLEATLGSPPKAEYAQAELHSDFKPSAHSPAAPKPTSASPSRPASRPASRPTSANPSRRTPSTTEPPHPHPPHPPHPAASHPAAAGERPPSASTRPAERKPSFGGGGTRFPSVVHGSAGPVGPVDPHAYGSQNRPPSRAPSPAVAMSANANALAHAQAPHLSVSTSSPSAAGARQPTWALPTPMASPPPEALRSPSPDSDIETSFSPVGRASRPGPPLTKPGGRPPPHLNHTSSTPTAAAPGTPAAAAATLAAATAAAAASAAALAALSPPALRIHPGRDLNVSTPWEDPQPGESVISVWTGTWNLHAKPFPDNLKDWIPADQFDLYVVGTEECENSIEASLVFSSKARWSACVTKVIGPGYKEVGQHTLQAIHIIVFVRENLYPYVHKIESASVATGVGNVVGNKGAVAIGFNVSNTSLLFLNSHFAAHQMAIEQRNADFHAINRKMPLRVRTLRKAGLGHLTNVCDRFERVFWLGDLNYRVGGNRRMVDALIAREMVEVMVGNDQLNLARERGEVFEGFIEGKITFMPTYKFDNGKDIYDTSKKRRIPSYTDRILWKPSSCIELLEYDSVPSIKCSDHRPVFATFKVKVVQRDEADIAKLVKREQGGSRACSIQ